jgi:hypothetical protein
MSWLIFLDTNILLDFYRLGGESASRQLSALGRHKDAIITCDQVRMEFMKKRQKVILDSLKNLGSLTNRSVPPIISDSKSAKMLLRHVEEATKRHTSVRTKIEKILQDPSHHDPVYRVLNRIFGHSGSVNLKRPHKTRYQIRASRESDLS